MTDSSLSQNTFPAAGLLRRLMAIFYDIFLLTAILFLAMAIFNAIFNQGEAIEPNSPFAIISSFYLGSIILLYFGWFWTHGGQTLGMKTWKIKLISNNNNSQSVNWKQALIREATAVISWGMLGVGFIWSVFDRKKRCWHDISSNTTLIDLRQADT